MFLKMDAEDFTLKFNADFISNSKSFIADICKLEGSTVPDFTNMTDGAITALFGSTLNELNLKLLNSRNVPLTPEFMCGLYTVRNLHKSTRILLESMLDNKKVGQEWKS